MTTDHATEAKRLADEFAQADDWDINKWQYRTDSHAAIDTLAADAARLDWLDKNPDVIKRAHGYRGDIDSWAVRRPDRITTDHDTIREAIDEAMAHQKAGGTK